MDSKKILLFGGSGFLGSTILKEDKQILAPSHPKLDLTNTDDLFNYIYKNEPSHIIYASGITRIDFAQKNKELTNLLNYKIPKQISKFSSKNNINFVYISTDAVFDGYKNKFEFDEGDKKNAISVYGNSKLKGEEAVLSSNNNFSVYRLITLFGLGNKNNFIEKLLNTLSKDDEFYGIRDQINNPLNVDLAAEAILFGIKNNLKGIYNLGALNSDSNYNFLVKVAKKLNLNSNLIKQITFKEFVNEKVAHRKRKSVLITDKFMKISKSNILRDLDDSISYLNLK